MKRHETETPTTDTRQALDRRGFVKLSTASIFGFPMGLRKPVLGKSNEMYGIIGKMNAVPGRRDELAGILLEGISGMPGCLSYIVAEDVEDENGLWITEVWDSEESHQASLSLSSVQEAIQRGRPLIDGFGDRFVTTPLGGQGLS